VVASGIARIRLVGWFVALAIALLSSCKQMPPAPPPAPQQVAPFSAGQPGGAYPGGWHALGFSRFRKETHYALVDDCGTTVVEARADGSSSGLIQVVDIDPRKYPWLIWRWRVPERLPVVDNTRREGDDAPARIDISFDGDFKNLQFGDRLWARQVKALTGMDLPYATLEYVWGDGAPPETTIINTWTERIRMVIVESGAERAGEWVTEKRNVYEDYRRVFGEEPGKITTIGIITDTDATKQKAEAYYGDIALLAAEPANTKGAEPTSPPGTTLAAGNHREGTECPAKDR
jgi:Protein of unknown function (DUF3047)